VEREGEITQVRTLKNNKEVEKNRKEDRDNSKETGSGGDGWEHEDTDWKRR
jgi:hypothetical protein